LSSILRALKKIQNETAALPEIQAGPGMSSSAMARKNTFLYKGIILVAILMGVALGGSWVIKSPQKDQGSDLQTVQGPPEMKASPQPGLESGIPKPENPSRTPVVPEPKIEMPAAHPPTDYLTDQPVMHDNGATNQVDLAKPEKEHGLEALQKPDENDTSRLISPDKRTKEQHVSSNYNEIDEKAGLDLQAISWASASHQRLAVINGTLCRENESVKGYTIKQINPDDVIVSNGAVTGKLVLKIR
jgi:hypothetical protein